MLVPGADTVFTAGTTRFLASGATHAGAIAARRDPPRPAATPCVEGGLVPALATTGRAGGRPLWLLGAAVVQFLDPLPGPPYELADAFGRAPSQGIEVCGVDVPGNARLDTSARSDPGELSLSGR